MREGVEAVAQSGQIARAGGSDGDAGGDAFDVGQGFQTAFEGFGAVFHQGANGFLAGEDVGAVAQGVVQPEGEQAAAHVGGAGVEDGKEGGGFFVAEGGGDFEVAPGGGVHVYILAFAFEGEAVEVARQAGLGEFDVVEQGAGRADGGGVFVGVEAEAAQILRAEVAGDEVETAVGGKLPGVETGDVGVFQGDFGRGFAVGQQNFRRLQAGEFVGKAVGCGDFCFELAALQRRPGQPQPFFVGADGNDAVGFFVFQ